MTNKVNKISAPWFLLLVSHLLISNSASAATVTTTADSGPGSLRGAIAAAAAGETIDFAVTGTLSLTNGSLLITNDLILRGPGPGSLVLQRATRRLGPGFRIL